MGSKIIFVRPNTPYQSYTDFWQLVKVGGFPICGFLDIKLDKKCTYIVSPYNFEWKPFLGDKPKARKARIILWDLERPIPRGGFDEYVRHGNRLLNDGYFDAIWVSDRQLAHDSGFDHVILGSDNGLARDRGSPLQLNAPRQKAYDYAHMSYINRRRKKILNKIHGRQAPNCWPPERNDMLQVVRFGLNIHQDDDWYFEPLRFALFAAYRLPIITETSYDIWPYTNHAVQVDTKRLPSCADELFRTDYQFWCETGIRINDLMCNEFNFGKTVRREMQ